jgi:hypothetical protein
VACHPQRVGGTTQPEVRRFSAFQLGVLMSDRAFSADDGAVVPTSFADGSALGQRQRRDADYGHLGHAYSAYRRPDPRIAAVILKALGPARTVLNVGAVGGRDDAVLVPDPRNIDNSQIKLEILSFVLRSDVQPGTGSRNLPGEARLLRCRLSPFLRERRRHRPAPDRRLGELHRYLGLSRSNQANGRSVPRLVAAR